MREILNKLKFDANGLFPAIAQDAQTSEVLMMVWMNKESLELTISSGFATYFSRSRQSLWKKGDTSGHIQEVVSITADCDFDCILLKVNKPVWLVTPVKKAVFSMQFLNNLAQAFASEVITRKTDDVKNQNQNNNKIAL